MTANNTSSLLKNANFGEIFEAKTGLNLENKKSPQTSKPACGLEFWRRVQDSNPRGHHCPNGFQDHPVMTASVTLHVFSADWFLKKVPWKKERTLGEKSPEISFLEYPEAIENTRFFGGRLPKWRFDFKTAPL